MSVCRIGLFDNTKVGLLLNNKVADPHKLLVKMKVCGYSAWLQPTIIVLRLATVVISHLFNIFLANLEYIDTPNNILNDMQLTIDLDDIKDNAQKEWLIRTLKLIGIKYKIGEPPQSLEEYNADLEAGREDLDNGNIMKAEDLKEEIQKW